MMAEGRQRENWSHTSATLALLANAHRDPKRRAPFRPQDFDPFAEKTPPPKAEVGILRRVFVKE